MAFARSVSRYLRPGIFKSRISIEANRNGHLDDTPAGECGRSSLLKGDLVHECRPNELILSSTSNGIKMEASVANMSILVPFYNKHKVAMDKLGKLFLEHPSILTLSSPYKIQKLEDLFKELNLEQAYANKIIQHNLDIVVREPDDLQRTVQFLRSLGLANGALAALLGTHLSLLALNEAEYKDLVSKVEFLESHGCSKKGLARLLLRWHKFTSTSFEEVIKPRVEFLVECGVEDKLEQVLLAYPWLLGSTSIDLKQKAATLKGLGLNGASLARVLTWCPNVTTSVDSLAMKEQLLLKAGLAKGTRSFGKALSVVGALKIDVLESRIQRFARYGISEVDAYEMFRKQPRILILSDTSFDAKMQFLLDQMKVPLERIVNIPSYLTYSLEARLKPRLSFVSCMASQGFLDENYGQWNVYFFPSDETFVKKVGKDHPNPVSVFEQIKKELRCCGVKSGKVKYWMQ